MTNKNDNIVICPSCGTALDKFTLYRYDCICFECGHFIDMDDYDCEDYDYYSCLDDDYYDDLWLESEKRKQTKKDMNFGRGSEDMLPILANADIEEDEDEMVTTLVMRFITRADYKTVESSFAKLDADIDYMEVVQDGKIKEFLKTKGGEKLAQGLQIKPEEYDEYVVIASFIFGDKDDSKKILVSTLCQAFPLCVIREEHSAYIMANNKGLAKGMIDVCNEDEIELLSLFLTGFEKYKILCYYLYWCEPYKKETASNIMIKWDKSGLISLAALRTPKEVPVIWQQYLETVEEMTVSANDKDSGVVKSFETMLEDVVNEEIVKKDIDETKSLVRVVSLRGVADFGLGGDAEDDETKI